MITFSKAPDYLFYEYSLAKTHCTWEWGRGIYSSLWDESPKSLSNNAPLPHLYFFPNA